MAYGSDSPPADERRAWRVGVDTGGTFTDLVAVDPEGRLRVVKVPSTPGGFEGGVMEALGRSGALGGDDTAGRAGRGTDTLGLSGLTLVHGSTVATNALLQRRVARTALLVTEGFRDLLLIGRQNRPRLYDLHPTRARAVIGEEDCFAVRERVGANGEVVVPVDEGALEAALDEVQRRGIRDVAVCLLFSFANSVHEQRVAAACGRRGMTCTISSEVLPEFREYERGSTTALCACLRPTVESYLGKLEELVGGMRVMQSNGGTLSVGEASRQAVRLLLSGPAGGVLGASFVAREAGCEDVITYDMGGTSTDVATICGGRPEWTTGASVDGLPVGVPQFDIHTVGAGGGSVAYVDAGGALRVGPRSAGAVPGPACYGRGGTEPTVTDANVFLGRIPAEKFLGGEMQLRAELAAEAVGRLARELGKSAEETALGILRVVESNMEQAVRAVTTRRGHDPRGFTLVSFGGAGGLHACRLAEALQIPRVLVPPYCGVLSALGMVVAPAVADATKTVLQLGADLDDSRLPAEYGYLSGLTADRIGPGETEWVEALADVRFRGQSHELTVAVQAPTLENIERNFLAAYEQRYGHLPVGRGIEVTTLRVRRTGRVPAVELPGMGEGGAVEERVTMIDDEGRRVGVLAVNRAALVRGVGGLRACGSSQMGMSVPPGEKDEGGRTKDEEDPSPRPSPRVRGEGERELQGGAGFLLIDAEATTYVPPGWRAEADERGIVVLTREGSGA